MINLEAALNRDNERDDDDGGGGGDDVLDVMMMTLDLPQGGQNEEYQSQTTNAMRDQR